MGGTTWSQDITTQLLATVERFSSDAADEVSSWPSPVDPSITKQTRARLERIRARGASVLTPRRSG